MMDKRLRRPHGSLTGGFEKNQRRYELIRKTYENLKTKHMEENFMLDFINDALRMYGYKELRSVSRMRGIITARK